jgi:hypothetical protein
MNKQVNRKKNGEEFYRSAKKTMGKRIHKKPNVEGRCATVMYASKCPDRIEKIKSGRVEKKKNPPPRNKNCYFCTPNCEQCASQNVETR